MRILLSITLLIGSLFAIPAAVDLYAQANSAREFSLIDVLHTAAGVNISVYDQARATSFGGPIRDFGLYEKDISKVKEGSARLICWYQIEIRPFDGRRYWPRCYTRALKKKPGTKAGLHLYRTSHCFPLAAAYTLSIRALASSSVNVLSNDWKTRRNA
jgi:hypothetical protein